MWSKNLRLFVLFYEVDYFLLVGTRDVRTQSDRAQRACACAQSRVQSARAQSAHVVPLSRAQPVRAQPARAQCVPNPCPRLTDGQTKWINI
jgi:hypothetical protein